MQCHACHGSGIAKDWNTKGQLVEVNCGVCKGSGQVADPSANERAANALERIAVAFESIAKALQEDTPQSHINGRVLDFSGAASDAHEEPPTHPLRASKAMSIEEITAQLQSGQRRGLHGFRRDQVQLILGRELQKVYATMGSRRFTQKDWERHRPKWAPAGIVVPRSMGMTWAEIQDKLVSGSL